MPLRFSRAREGTLDIEVSPNSGTIDGVTTDSMGQPLPGARVVLMPARNRGRTELFKAVTSSSTAAFTIDGVTPGDYILTAWEAIEPFAFFDPELIREAEARGTAMRVAESSKQTVTVLAK